MVGTEGSLPGSLPAASQECLSAAAVGAGVAAAAVPGLLLLLLIGGVLLALPLGLFIWSKKRCLQQQQQQQEQEIIGTSIGEDDTVVGSGSGGDGLLLGAEAESSEGLEGQEDRQQEKEEEGAQGQGGGGCCGGAATAASCACAEEKGGELMSSVGTSSGGAAQGATAVGGGPSSGQLLVSVSSVVGKQVPLRILYATTTGTARDFATQMQREAFAMNVSSFHFDVTLTDIADYDYVDLLEEETLVVFVVATYTDGKPPQSALDFFDYIEDASKDFRFGGAALKGVQFGIFGLGGAVYEDKWCKPAKDLEHALLQLGATMIVNTGLGDDASDLGQQWEDWKDKAWPALCEQYARLAGVAAAKAEAAKTSSASSSSGCGTCASTSTTNSKDVYKVASSWEEQDPGLRQLPSNSTSNGHNTGSGNGNGKTRVLRNRSRKKRKEEAMAMAQQQQQEEEAGQGEEGEEARDPEDVINESLIDWSDEEEEDDEEEDGVSSFKPPSKAKASTSGSSSGVMDLEDLGTAMLSSSSPAEDGKVAEATAPREMVTPLQRKSLTKEGYKIIGSHSAVKLCRWTKHQLRGRGGCYKWTFYGIHSYQCMEMTPSLACANKCVFCWRHHKNPVGKEWRWVVDNPLMIVQEGVERHQNMIYMFKGVPGLIQERWEAAMTVRHCALSLVGEPIMYPHINELLAELHRRHISTFLVTNAQFPEKLAALAPVTQLYVSIDAATKDTLKAIDRPLFKDFWERFLWSLEQLRVKGQRTVYRLTLVKQWNMDEIDNYVKLIGIGEPDLIEIKGVTFCGKSDASSLRMENVPWHHEVRKFAQAIADRTGGKYEFMAEHAHSCCTLLALKDKFFVKGKWHTWIDFNKFNTLVRQYEQDGSEFSSVDYMAETPHWALKDAVEEGFDPSDTRHHRMKNGKPVEFPYKPSDSGCG